MVLEVSGVAGFLVVNQRLLADCVAADSSSVLALPLFDGWRGGGAAEISSYPHVSCRRGRGDGGPAARFCHYDAV